MNRRGFLSSLIAVPAAAYVAPNVLATNAPFAEYRMNTTGIPQVERADGRRFIVGQATESVQAGDFVQILMVGPTTLKVSSMQ